MFWDYFCAGKKRQFCGIGFAGSTWGQMHLTVTFACIPKLKVNLYTDTHRCPTQKKNVMLTLKTIS